MPDKIKILLKLILKVCRKAYTLLSERRKNADHFIQTNGERLVLTELFRVEDSPIVIFDIGANVGNYSKNILELAQKFGKYVEIHLFEPQQTNIEQLKLVFSKNPQIRINDFGISDKCESLPIYANNDGSELASLYYRKHFKENNFEIKETLIKLDTLENYIIEKNIKKVNFVKIDVEGHELAVIKGIGSFLCAPNLILDKIQFEYGGTYLDSGTKLETIYRLLEPHYAIGKLTHNGVVMQKFDPKMEDYNYANYLAVKNNNIKNQLTI